MNEEDDDSACKSEKYIDINNNIATSDATHDNLKSLNVDALIRAASLKVEFEIDATEFVRFGTEKRFSASQVARDIANRIM